MEIAFFTEMGFDGEVPRNHPNMRTEFAWMCALEADHYSIIQAPFITKKYDLGIVIIPKKNPDFDINSLKQSCNKVAVMQEGPNWYWQDYDLPKQIWYYNTLTSADIIFTHNKVDKKYYQGLTNHKDVRVLQSLMIEDAIDVESLMFEKYRSEVIIGGNFVSWYGGFDSYIVASEISDKVFAPSMGRKQVDEEQLLTHLPYLNWRDWITQLSKFKYGIHLMRTHAAGTFALNCAYLGIPCIGYYGLDTQETCHPDLTVEVGDLVTAKKLITLLRDDKEFYQNCSNDAKQYYRYCYSEEKFKQTFYDTFI
jgi:hypothetical protein